MSSTCCSGSTTTPASLNYVGRSAVHPGRRCLDREARADARRPRLHRPRSRRQSRWTGKERLPEALRPELVVEVSADHITDQYFRHGARILRWRTDKRPRECTLDQLRRG